MKAERGEEAAEKIFEVSRFKGRSHLCNRIGQGEAAGADDRLQQVTGRSSQDH